VKNKIKKTIITLLVVTAFINNGYTEIKDSLFATVGNKAVTESDIVRELKSILILNNQSFTKDKKAQLQSLAVKETIKRNIKRIEIEKYNALTFNKSDLDNQINQLSINVNTDTETLKKRFENNGIDFSEIIENIKTELLWNSLIYALYNDRLNVDQKEIEEQLEKIKNKKTIDEYLISEIIIKHNADKDINSQIKNIIEKIKIEGFDKVAMNLSISDTAVKGGDLGWIDENVISKKFKSKILNTPIGGISDAIVLTEGILFFNVRNKRSKENIINIDNVKNELVSAEKQKILNMYSLSHYETIKRQISVNYF